MDCVGAAAILGDARGGETERVAFEAVDRGRLQREGSAQRDLDLRIRRGGVIRKSARDRDLRPDPQAISEKTAHARDQPGQMSKAKQILRSAAPCGKVR